MPVARYVSKPVEIDALQWTGENYDEINEFVDRHAGQPGFRQKPKKDKAQVYDSTQDDWVNVHVGDYIIKGTQGEFYPCAEEVFQRKYAALDVPLISDSVPADSPFREGAEGL